MIPQPEDVSAEEWTKALDQVDGGRVSFISRCVLGHVIVYTDQDGILNRIYVKANA